MIHSKSTVPLSGIAEINPNVNLKGLKDTEEVSFVPMADVTDSGRWINRQTRPLKDVRVGYTGFQEGDVLFAKITPCMENGKGTHAIGLVNGFGFGSTEFHVLRAKGENSPQFLFHWLQSSEFRNRALAYMGGSAGQQRVQPLFFYRFEIPEIACAEQVRVAEILDTLDAAIEKSEALIAKLKQVRAGILHDLLTCGVDESGKLRRENWQVVSLGALAEIASGVTLGRMVDGADSMELPYLRVANVQDGFIDISDVKTVRIFQSELQRYALTAGDVLMNEGGDFDKLGRGAVWDGRISPCLHQNHVFRVRCGSRLLPDFLALYSGSPAGKRYFVQSSKQTTNLASINSTQLKAFPVLLPDITEQAMIVEQIHEVDSLIGKETAGREKLQTIKSGLSTDLLTGQVRVPPDLELP